MGSFGTFGLCLKVSATAAPTAFGTKTKELKTEEATSEKELDALMVLGLLPVIGILELMLILLLLGNIFSSGLTI